MLNHEDTYEFYDDTGPNPHYGRASAPPRGAAPGSGQPNAQHAQSPSFFSRLFRRDPRPDEHVNAEPRRGFFSSLFSRGRRQEHESSAPRYEDEDAEPLAPSRGSAFEMMPYERDDGRELFLGGMQDPAVLFRQMDTIFDEMHRSMMSRGSPFDAFFSSLPDFAAGFGAGGGADDGTRQGYSFSSSYSSTSSVDPQTGKRIEKRVQRTRGPDGREVTIEKSGEAGPEFDRQWNEEVGRYNAETKRIPHVPYNRGGGNVRIEELPDYDRSWPASSTRGRVEEADE